MDEINGMEPSTLVKRKLTLCHLHLKQTVLMLTLALVTECIRCWFDRPLVQL